MQLPAVGVMRDGALNFGQCPDRVADGVGANLCGGEPNPVIEREDGRGAVEVNKGITAIRTCVARKPFGVQPGRGIEEAC